MSRHLLGLYEVRSKRDFEIGGLWVTEFILAEYKDSKDAVVWVRTPPGQMAFPIVNPSGFSKNRQNAMIFHAFEVGNKEQENLAREKVKKAFCDYWQIIPLYSVSSAVASIGTSLN